MRTRNFPTAILPNMLIAPTLFPSCGTFPNIEQRKPRELHNRSRARELIAFLFSSPLVYGLQEIAMASQVNLFTWAGRAPPPGLLCRC
jgi:hypothetical protein